MDTGALALERAAAGVIGMGVVSEQCKVGSIRARADAGCNGIHNPAAPLGGKLVEDRFFRRSERGKPPELGAGTVGNAVKDDEKYLACGHSYGMVGRAD